MAGIPSPTDNCMVKSLVQGYNRTHSSPTIRKEPITPGILLNLLQAHDQPGATLADKRILFICFISYAGFLRYDELSSLTRRDCVFLPDRLIIHIPSSKTDQFRQGSNVTIARTNNPTCPVKIAEQYFSAIGDSPDSSLPAVRRLTTSKHGLRATSHGLSYTRTREVLLEALKPHVQDISQFGLHSLRSGGATSASNADVPPLLISQHGRWKTAKARDAYLKTDSEHTLLPSLNLGL